MILISINLFVSSRENYITLHDGSFIQFCYLFHSFLNQEARNLEDFLENFKNDPTVKIPQVYKNLSGSRVLVMEWIDGIRCTNPQVWMSG